MSEEERDTDHQGSSVPSRLREVSFCSIQIFYSEPRGFGRYLKSIGCKGK